MERISGQVHQVEQHAKQMGNQIAIAKRAAHKAEVDIVGLEKTKLEQVCSKKEGRRAREVGEEV